MLNLYSTSLVKDGPNDVLSNSEKLAVYYHDFFDYPLSLGDLIRWLPSEKILFRKDVQISSKSNFVYMEGRNGLVYKRMLRKHISDKKMMIAKKASKILSVLPTIKMIGVTGSLAMNNSTDDSDIDLLVITSNKRLWTTRLLVLSLLKLLQIPTRKSGETIQTNKLCLNMWIDEGDLAWKKSDRNLYTSHEIAQIVPLVNKKRTYELFLQSNKWVLGFWPNSIGKKYIRSGISNMGIAKTQHSKDYLLSTFLEKIAYFIQYSYMKKKITREVVTSTRAFFHPQDWGKMVLNRLSS